MFLSTRRIIGHVYTAEVMIPAQFVALEGSFEAAMRALTERGVLCRQKAEKSCAADNLVAATQWDAAMHLDGAALRAPSRG